MDDKTRAKELAKAHRAALDELYNPSLNDAERERIMDRRYRLSVKMYDHRVETGWSYEVPDFPGEPGRWANSTRGLLGWRTEWIDDEGEN